MRAKRVMRWLRKIELGRVGTQIKNRRDGDEQPTDLIYHRRIDRPPPGGALDLPRFERIVDQDRLRLRDRPPERHVSR